MYLHILDTTCIVKNSLKKSIGLVNLAKPSRRSDGSCGPILVSGKNYFDATDGADLKL